MSATGTNTYPTTERESYGTPVWSMGDGSYLAAGHGRRSLAALIALRRVGSDREDRRLLSRRPKGRLEREVAATWAPQQRWVVFRDGDEEFKFMAEWVEQGVSGALPVTELP